ncbi:MAG: L-aspartate oxidase [Gordonia sp. (in: high G+C Gram-positive bacteria)]|uniref:L-aspartate oxidase n=1 Tax=Gordonia sp. (in: high G+C Gram-positive bacteria) TaxID=84139 RepID=UPI0039E56BA2
MGTEMRAELVVVGAGVAGLTAALSAAEAGLTVVVLNKGRAWRPEAVEQSTSTFYAQGGIAVVDPDDPDDGVALHVRDTLAAGAGLTVPDPTEQIVAAGWSAVERLVGWGARFDSAPDGRFLRTREGGHSVRRIIHAGGDATGAQVQAALGGALARAGVRVLDDARATGILTGHDGAAAGVAYSDDEGDGAVWAPTVLLATGGVGHSYSATTNPAGATGDGIALALRAGAAVADLEFIQFHPTMLYVPGARGRRTLVSEALRGEGGRLVDIDGASVTEGVHPLGDLAPRDVVARAVRAAMERTGAPHVYLDFTAIEDFERRFPTVLAGVRAAGVSTDDGRLPVVPGAHYLCGGVVTDAHGRTGVPGLLAAGEVARTGLHGANRLASNSLLEGLVMGRRAAAVAVERRAESIPAARVDVPARLPAAERGALQDLMSARVALLRDAEGLAGTAEFLESAAERVQSDRAAAEDAALTLTARAVVAAASAREESRGCHYRADRPAAADEPRSRGFVWRDGVFAEAVVPEIYGVSPVTA